MIPKKLASGAIRGWMPVFEPDHAPTGIGGFDMRLASYALRGRPSFGAVVGEGIVDLRPRLRRFSNLQRGVSRPGARSGQSRRDRRAPGRAARRSRAVAAAAGAGKNPLHRHQLRQPRARITTSPSTPKYPSMFYRAPNSLVGHGQHLIRPKISEQLDYEGEIAMVIGRDCKHRAEGTRARGDRRH